MSDHPYDSDPEEVYLPKVYRCRTNVAIIQRVMNLEDYSNHLIQDYYLAFNVTMFNFNVNYLKSGDLCYIASKAENLLPNLRERTSRIRARTNPLHRIPEIKSVRLLAEFVKIDETNRSKEYVKRLMVEVHEHTLVLWHDEKDIAMYRLTDMLRIKISLRVLIIRLNSMIAFHQITKKNLAI